MARRTSRPVLTADQQADAERLRRQRSDALAEQLAATTDATLFGTNEFAVREIVLRLGAKAVELAADRAKKVTTGAVALAPPAPERPSSSGGSGGPSSPSSARSA